MVNKERLWGQLMELGKIGESTDKKKGLTRLVFTPEEDIAKKLIREYMVDAGLTVMEDAAGNLIGKRIGKNSDLPVIMLGSHIDTVFRGGKFDGALGVLSGIEVARSLNERNEELQHTLEVVSFTDEEGARFSTGMLGSQAMTGNLDVKALDRKDEQGITLKEALTNAGYDPDKLTDAERAKGSIAAYLEVHIEQGKVLEKNGLSVGVVTGIAGPRWFRITLAGEAGHAGSTPMNLRRDPLAAAAEIITHIEDIARRQKNTVATVGQFSVEPGGINIIPEKVSFSLDLRDEDLENRTLAETAIKEKIAEITDKRELDLNLQLLHNLDPVKCDPVLVSLAIEASKKLEMPTIKMVSGAGHDSINLAGIAPIGMIFVRSQQGFSHRPDEWSTKEDCYDGARLLYQTVLNVDKDLR